MSQAVAMDVDNKDINILETKPTSLKQLKKVVAFRIAFRWRDIGVQLQFTADQLDAIDRNQSTRQHPVEECCKDMFSLWKRKGKNVTPKKLIGAIEEGAENANFAADLENEKDDILSTDYLERTVTPRIATKWYDVGLELDITDHELDGIKHLTDPCGEKCRSMLQKWLQRKDDPKNKRLNPTWQNMYNAMCALEMIKAAEDMKDELKRVEDETDTDCQVPN